MSWEESSDWLLQDHLTGTICFGEFTTTQPRAVNLRGLRPDVGHVPWSIQIQEVKCHWLHHKTKKPPLPGARHQKKQGSVVNNPHCLHWMNYFMNTSRKQSHTVIPQRPAWGLRNTLYSIPGEGGDDFSLVMLEVWKERNLTSIRGSFWIIPLWS